MAAVLVRSASLDDDETRNRKVTKLGSLSAQQLLKLRRTWRCARRVCPRHHEYGRHKDDGDAPFVLLCGHYLCGGCRNAVLATKQTFMCELTTGHKPDECHRTYSSEADWARLRPALHIKYAMGLLQRRGLICPTCEVGGYKKDRFEHPPPQPRPRGLSPARLLFNQDANKDEMTFRTSRNAFVVCVECEFSSNEDESCAPDLKINCKTESKDERAKNSVFCLNCAASHHHDHRRDCSRLKPDEPQYAHLFRRMKPPAPRTTKRLFKKAKLSEDEESDKSKDDTMSAEELKSAQPWNLVMVTSSEMKELVDYMMICGDCERPYMLGEDASAHNRHPFFLPCGHIVCGQCKKNGEIGGLSDHLSCKRGCPIEEGVIAVKAIASDFSVAASFDFTHHRECFKCALFFPSDMLHQLEGSTFCSECFFKWDDE